MAARNTDLNLSSARARVPTNIVSRAFPSELVLLNLQTGQYHSLNPTAGRMFDAVQAEPLGVAAARLSKELGETRTRVESDLVRLVLDLEERGLVEIEYPEGDTAAR
jgi:hypothetical protein